MLFILLWALNPRQIHLSNEILIENFLAFINILFIISFAKSINTRDKILTLISGFFLGVSILTRARLVFFLIPPVIYFLLKNNKEYLLKTIKIMITGYIFVFLCFINLFLFSNGKYYLTFEKTQMIYNFYLSVNGHIGGYDTEQKQIINKKLIKIDNNEIINEILEYSKKNYISLLKTTFSRFFYVIYKSFLFLGDNYNFYFLVFLLLFFIKIKADTSISFAKSDFKENFVSMSYYLIFYCWLTYIPVFVCDSFIISKNVGEIIERLWVKEK